MTKTKTPIGAKFSAVLVLFLAMGMFAVFFTADYICTPLEEETRVMVHPGASTRRIAEDLENHNVVASSLVFRVIVRLQGLDNSLQTGFYSFSPEEDIFSVIEKISRGDVLKYRVTVPEGLTMEQTAQILADKSGDFSTEEFLQAAEQNEFRYEYLPEPDDELDYRLQGYLFPATYEFPVGSQPRVIIRQMLERFDREITPQLVEKAQELGYEIHELITIASLIEREAKIDEERPLISSVIHNRLDINMRLQIDATVQYALPEWKSRLLFVDLEYDSPYNTYLYPGLPPGPICNPGRASIRGAFYPVETEYLFYIANPDGSHNFSRTFEEHRLFRIR